VVAKAAAADSNRGKRRIFMALAYRQFCYINNSYLRLLDEG
jgi:hypothetical protein